MNSPFELEKALLKWREEMLAAGIKTPVPLEELESHLRDGMEQLIASGMSPQSAFETTVQEMGNAAALNQEFAKTNQLQGTPMFNHNRMYSIVLTMLTVLASMTTFGLMNWQKSVGGPVGHLSSEAIPWMIAVNLFYALAMGITLFTRLYRPASGHRLTRWLNWALLPALPSGTVLGLYGLWLLYREKPQPVQ